VALYQKSHIYTSLGLQRSCCFNPIPHGSFRECPTACCFDSPINDPDFVGLSAPLPPPPQGRGQGVSPAGEGAWGCIGPIGPTQ
jgi:hypothetical protein